MKKIIDVVVTFVLVLGIIQLGCVSEQGNSGQQDSTNKRIEALELEVQQIREELVQLKSEKLKTTDQPVDTSNKTASKPNKEKTAFEKAYAKASYSITAPDLHEAYDANAIAAAAKYKNKIVLVRGYIDGFSSVLDDPVVKLKTNNMFMTVDCYMQKSLIPVLGQLKKDEDVLVVGIVDEHIMSVTLKDCLIARSPKKN